MALLNKYLPEFVHSTDVDVSERAFLVQQLVSFAQFAAGDGGATRLKETAAVCNKPLLQPTKDQQPEPVPEGLDLDSPFFSLPDREEDAFENQDRDDYALAPYMFFSSFFIVEFRLLENIEVQGLEGSASGPWPVAAAIWDARGMSSAIRNSGCTQDVKYSQNVYISFSCFLRSFKEDLGVMSNINHDQVAAMQQQQQQGGMFYLKEDQQQEAAQAEAAAPEADDPIRKMQEQLMKASQTKVHI